MDLVSISVVCCPECMVPLAGEDGFHIVLVLVLALALALALVRTEIERRASLDEGLDTGVEDSAEREGLCMRDKMLVGAVARKVEARRRVANIILQPVGRYRERGPAAEEGAIEDVLGVTVRPPDNGSNTAHIVAYAAVAGDRAALLAHIVAGDGRARIVHQLPPETDDLAYCRLSGGG
ncbi:uncharacterized protein SEPMUDRAFT_113995 [Sphaerulina musiva SO2202]|uniref:Uncharacterized protein n=1 Tax=Sphaerulina musiva (strain SO2202) TaxID=692275 RepID=M3DAG6_SPHMS|nr:uncharacterized protein SEPMUDRAFT_113995 [Sphaerulina musiva SO2202]EMF14859.1 hypothetical protein SEPMUDRAFT_113995 [Sphaerulina musiva SO2202]